MYSDDAFNTDNFQVRGHAKLVTSPQEGGGVEVLVLVALYFGLAGALGVLVL